MNIYQEKREYKGIEVERRGKKGFFFTVMEKWVWGLGII